MANATANIDLATIRITLEHQGHTLQFAPIAPVATDPPTPTTDPKTDLTLEAPATFFAQFDPPRLVEFEGPTGKVAATVFNAAVHFDSPGQYTALGQRIVVTPASRKRVHVSSTGNDNHDGTSPDKSVKTLARAVSLLTDNAALLLHRGEKFAVEFTLTLRASNIVIASYGDAILAQPTIVWAGSSAYPCIFDVHAPADRVVIDSIAFDTLRPAASFDHKNMPDAVRLTGGTHITIRRCTFNTVGSAINGNGNPADVLIDQCNAPLVSGLRSYFAWVQGQRWTFTHNRALNSTREHIIRIGGGENIAIINNDFANIDRTQAATDPDPRDGAKNVLTIQKGARAAVAHNKITGRIGVGPLGGADGKHDTSSRWNTAVIDSNHITGQVVVHHGASDITITKNKIHADQQVAINVDGHDTFYDRTTVRTRIENNTVTNNMQYGSLLRVNDGAKDVKLIGNRYEAPKFQTGGWTSAFVYVEAQNLAAFSEIRDNIWPASVKTNDFSRGGVFYVWPTWADTRGYLKLDDWNRLPQVADDRMV
jgi:hypothetical protein